MRTKVPSSAISGLTAQRGRTSIIKRHVMSATGRGLLWEIHRLRANELQIMIEVTVFSGLILRY